MTTLRTGSNRQYAGNWVKAFASKGGTKKAATKAASAGRKCGSKCGKGGKK